LTHGFPVATCRSFDSGWTRRVRALRKAGDNGDMQRDADTSPEAADALLRLLVDHVPDDVEIGRPLYASVDTGGGAVLSAAALWLIRADAVERLWIGTGGDVVEQTTFMAGREVARTAG